jgi:hypothetical protein
LESVGWNLLKKNKKIKRADQMLPEVHGTTLSSYVFITHKFNDFPVAGIYFTTLFSYLSGSVFYFTAYKGLIWKRVDIQV